MTCRLSKHQQPSLLELDRGGPRIAAGSGSQKAQLAALVETLLARDRGGARPTRKAGT